MANKRKKTAPKTEEQKAVEQAYRKERERILSFMRRARARGYNTSKIDVPQIPKTITEGSVRNLRKLTKEKLYASATALNDLGKIVSGTQKHQEEVQAARNKSAETRKANRAKQNLDPKSSKFFEQRQQSDIANINRLQTDTVYASSFDEGKIVEQNVRDRIHDISTDNLAGALKLEQALDNSINMYTANGQSASKFYQRLAQTSEDVIALIDTARKYKAGSDQFNSILNSFYTLLKGSPLTLAEAKELDSTKSSY